MTQKDFAQHVSTYNDLKKKHPEALLIFRVGETYQLYQEDAERAVKVPGFVVTKYNEGKEFKIAVFPFHSLDKNLPLLIRAGFRCAICDGLQEDHAAKPEKKKDSTPKKVCSTVQLFFNK